MGRGVLPTDLALLHPEGICELLALQLVPAGLSREASGYGVLCNRE